MVNIQANPKFLAEVQGDRGDNQQFVVEVMDTSGYKGMTGTKGRKTFHEKPNMY